MNKNRAKLSFEYYYKVNECKAKDSRALDCICWHDEGTGPYKEQKPNDETPLVEWRIKDTSND